MDRSSVRSSFVFLCAASALYLIASPLILDARNNVVKLFGCCGLPISDPGLHSKLELESTS
jgi:hypothetical protein